MYKLYEYIFVVPAYANKAYFSRPLFRAKQIQLWISIMWENLKYSSMIYLNNSLKIDLVNYWMDFWMHY